MLKTYKIFPSIPWQLTLLPCHLHASQMFGCELENIFSDCTKDDLIEGEVLSHSSVTMKDFYFQGRMGGGGAVSEL